ncbi:MAG: gfo/Idh/MocA family oxidoreductase, partial [Bryobacterales bacterium]|nr:gfo/Idh/MocA family oxidoreductase [Bryobacterales bacterium]
MNRRQFFMNGTAMFAGSRLAWAQDLLGAKPKRVGLIGSGWYGKADLLRLIQVAPVEVVSLCDV